MTKQLTEAQRLLPRVRVTHLHGHVSLYIDGWRVCKLKDDDPIALALLKFDVDHRAALEASE